MEEDEKEKSDDYYKIPELAYFLLGTNKTSTNELEKSIPSTNPNDLDFEFLKKILNDDKLQWIYNFCLPRYRNIRGRGPSISLSLKKFIDQGDSKLKPPVHNVAKDVKHNKYINRDNIQTTPRNFEKILREQFKNTLPTNTSGIIHSAQTSSSTVTAPASFKKNESHYLHKNTIVRMRESTGPMGALYTYLATDLCDRASSSTSLPSRKRIRVLTRSHTFVRGYCEGYLKAFDHHWNLVLADVDEYYILKPDIKNFYGPSSRNLRKDPKRGSQRLKFGSGSLKLGSFSVPPKCTVDQASLSATSDGEAIGYDHDHDRFHRTRHLPVLFVRGDNVVLVCQSPNY